MMLIDYCLVLALALSTEVHAGVIHSSAGDSTLSQSHPTATSHTPRKLPPPLSSLLPLGPLPPPLPSRLPPILSSLLALPSSLHLPIPSSLHLPIPSSLHLPIPSSIPIPIPIPSSLHLPLPSSLHLSISLSLPLPTHHPIRISSIFSLPIPSTLPLPLPISPILPIPLPIPSTLSIPLPIPPIITLPLSPPPIFPGDPTVVHGPPSTIPTSRPVITTPTPYRSPLTHHTQTSPFRVAEQTPPSQKTPLTQGNTANHPNKGPPKATPVNPPHTDPPPTGSPQVNSPHQDQPQVNPPHTDPPQVNPPHTDQLQVNPPHTDSPHPSGLHSPISLKVSATIHVQSVVESSMTQSNAGTPSPLSSLPVSDTATAPSGSGPGSRPLLGTTAPSTSSVHSIHSTNKPLPNPSNKPHMVHIIGGAIGGSLLLLISLLLVLLLLRRRRQRALEVRGGNTASEARQKPQLPLVDRILKSLHIGSTATNITPFHKPAFLRSSRGFTRIRDDDDDDESFHATGSPSRESAHILSQSANVSASELDSPQTTLVEAHSGMNHGRRGKRLRNSYARNSRAPSFFFRYRNYLSVQNPSSSQDLPVASTSSRPMTIRDQSTDSMVQTTSRGPPSLLFTSSDVAADTSTESGHLTTQWFSTSSDSMRSLSSQRTSTHHSLP